MRGFDKCCCSAWSCIENPFVLDPVDLHADLHALPAVLLLPALDVQVGRHGGVGSWGGGALPLSWWGAA